MNINFNSIPLDSLANPHLLAPHCKITEDIVKYVLPQFLEGAELCSLAHANKEWKHLLVTGVNILKKWERHPFLVHTITQLGSHTDFEIIETVFFETLEKVKPLAQRLGFAKELQKVSLQAFLDRIEDLNLVAFCEDLQGIPEKEADETLTCYAEKLKKWLETSPTIGQMPVLNLQLKLTLLPKEISLFTWLEQLNLFRNQLISLPDSIGNLRDLRHLSLPCNQLRTIPSSLGNLEHLEVLNLSYNQLSTLPDSIGNLGQLEALNLSNNQLKHVPDSFIKMENLRKLDLSDNQLSKLPDTIGNLRQLRVLDLSNNQLSKLPDSIGNLEHLEKLYLNDNQLSALPDSIGNLEHLKELYLFKNKLKALPQSIKKLESLELDLTNGQIAQLLYMK